MLKFPKKSWLIGVVLTSLVIAGGYWLYSTAGLHLQHMSLSAEERPVYLGSFDTVKAKPMWISAIDNSLYVSYASGPIVDIYTFKGEKTKEIRASLFTKEAAALQGMAKSGEKLLVADYANKALTILDGSGKVQDGFLQTTDGQSITPIGVTARGRVFYVTNLNYHGWFALGDDGELITEVKGDQENTKLEFPYGIQATEDGRVLVTDPQGGKIKAFNCAGWYAYDLPTEEVGLKNPQGIALDGLGRIHVVDNGTGQIFVYSNEGKYMFAYGEKEAQNLSNVAVDASSRLIFATDTDRNKIMVWGY